MRTVFGAVFICCELSVLVAAYSKVSRNGEARANVQDVAFTVNPVYVVTPDPRAAELRPGEAVDHPSTAKYSTLDEEMVAKLNNLSGRSRAQERFHPPASFEHVLAHANAVRQQTTNSDSIPSGVSSSKNVVYAKPIVSMTYDYPSINVESKLKPIMKPTAGSDSYPIYPPLNLPDSYSVGSDSPQSPPSDYDSKIPSFDFNSNPPKSVDFPDHYDRPFQDVPSYAAPDPYNHEDIIYDHIPEDHFHHHHYKPPTTTEEPEMMDQRLNKRPYSYYYIGKKLWYIPLYFSIYFIIYIAALVLKSIARHKINFPANLAAAADNARSVDAPGWMDYVGVVLEGVEKYGKVFVRE